MNPVEQLVFSYIRAMDELDRTGDPGYRKTSSMFRERLRRQGVTVLDWTPGPGTVTARIKTNGEVSNLKLPLPR